jgi:hypothetical protein
MALVSRLILIGTAAAALVGLLSAGADDTDDDGARGESGGTDSNVLRNDDLS